LIDKRLKVRMQELGMTLATSSSNSPNRWVQLVIGIVCTVMVANLQYAWTYFVDPINAQHHWGREAIQWGFTIFVAAATWLVPLEGWFVDRFGPRVMVAIGGSLVAIAWVINSYAQTLPALYLGMALSGIGNGAIWGTCIANALKWFPDRRGLAAGLTAMGFGGGAALTVVPIIKVIAAYDYQTAFFWFGLGQGLILVLMSFFMVQPPLSLRRNANAAQAIDIGSTPIEMLKTPIFWVIYLMFVTVAGSGLIVTAQLGPIVNDYKIANVVVDLFIVSSTVLVASAVIDNVMNGLARPVFGWISDHIGRENTMTFVFILGAGAYWGLGSFGSHPYLFILTAGLVYFTWGEIYGLFPATCTDFFGSRYAATNAGILYTGKGVAAWLVPAASWLRDYTGTWYSVFVVAMIANVAVAALAFFVLKPARKKQQPLIGVSPSPVSA
jgi:OFA family oxalate/formate antiporter-like MFS transporter